MKICTVKSNALANGISKVIKVRKDNAVMPVLESVLCKTVKGGIVLTCSNLQDTIITGIKADVTESGKEFLIPVKAQTILLQLKDVDIDIVNGENLNFIYGSNVIKVTAEDPSKFPNAPKMEEPIKFKVEDRDRFQQLLDMHKKFLSNDDDRICMTGIHWTEKAMASTDAYRVCMTKYETPGDDLKFDVILSKAFINAFTSIETAFTVKIADHYIAVNDKETQVISRIIDAKFPQVEAVIPKDNGLHIKMNRAQLMGNIKLALSMTDRATKRLKLSFISNGYVLQAADKDLVEEIKLTGESSFEKGDDTEFEIGFNGAFLHQQLDVLSNEDVVIEASTNAKATVFHEEDTIFLLMPLHSKN